MSTVKNPGPLAALTGLAARARVARVTEALCSMPVSAEAVPLLRRFARDTSRQWDLPGNAEEAACVIVTELVTNVLLHSGSRDVTLRIVRGDCSLTIHVDDDGRWKRREGARRASQDANVPCGRGLRLVDAYAVACEVDGSDYGTRVRAEIAVGA
ncbi:ATP-binding protein [Streptomyces sp. NA04227]|uniref:ATP-binding protein n=1 Tax=Streptomyces sp. NA04227 TaxID=2742136 RepID=UPI001592A467|nr:ATP-binding protein [Streptomyces sp. NA04227]QKW06547.1 ATP-binding protein [Streptomyces sp. NA04227]